MLDKHDQGAYSLAMTEHNWKLYRRKGTTEMRRYEGDGLDGVSVTEEDREEAFGPGPWGYVARDQKTHTDQWYVSLRFFNGAQFEEVQRGDE